MISNDYEPSQISKQEMVELLKILSGEKQTIINPEMLMEDGKLFAKVDIYGLAAVVSGLKTLIERSHGALEEKILWLDERVDSLEKRVDVEDLGETV